MFVYTHAFFHPLTLLPFPQARRKLDRKSRSTKEKELCVAIADNLVLFFLFITKDSINNNNNN